MVCRELGFPGAQEKTRESRFGSVNSRFAMDGISCNEHAERLLDCEYSTSDDCGSGEGAGVICRDGLGEHFPILF